MSQIVSSVLSSPSVSDILRDELARIKSPQPGFIPIDVRADTPNIVTVLTNLLMRRDFANAEIVMKSREYHALDVKHHQSVLYFAAGCDNNTLFTVCQLVHFPNKIAVPRAVISYLKFGRGGEFSNEAVRVMLSVCKLKSSDIDQVLCVVNNLIRKAKKHDRTETRYIRELKRTRKVVARYTISRLAAAEEQIAGLLTVVNNLTSDI